MVVKILNPSYATFNAVTEIDSSRPTVWPLNFRIIKSFFAVDLRNHEPLSHSAQKYNKVGLYVYANLLQGIAYKSF